MTLPTTADFARARRAHRARLAAFAVAGSGTVGAFLILTVVKALLRGSAQAQPVLVALALVTLWVGSAGLLGVLAVSLWSGPRHSSARGFVLLLVPVALLGGSWVVVVSTRPSLFPQSAAAALVLVVGIAVGSRVAGTLRWWGAPRAELAVERGEPSAATRIERGLARGIWIPRWLMVRARLELETDPDASARTAAEALARDPEGTEALAAIALAELAGGRVSDETLARLDLGLRAASALGPTLRRSHERVLREAERAWALAALGRRDDARAALSRARVPTPPFAAAEVRWRRGRALLALGEAGAARAEWAVGAEAPGWAGRRCRAELDRRP